MTGFGAGRRAAAGWTVRVQLRSVNHRHLDVRLKLPSAFNNLRESLTSQVKRHINRGRIEGLVEIERDTEQAPSVHADVDLAIAYQQALTTVAEALDHDDKPGLMAICSMPGVLRSVQVGDAAEVLEGMMGEVMAAAVDALVEARGQEGAHLARDLLQRHDVLTSLHGRVAEHADGLAARRQDQLRDRVETLLARRSVPVDEVRLEHELVLIADRTDITEELVRFSGHLQAVRQALESSEEPGRKLGFLVQELLREANTMGSKAGSMEITELVVAIKVELEKLREQALNLA